MARRSHAQVANDARTAERQSAVDYLRGKALSVEALILRGTVDKDSGGLLMDRLRVTARDIEAGLHITEKEKSDDRR